MKFTNIKKMALLGTTILGVVSLPAHAKIGDPVDVGNGVKIDPIVDARIRYETVDEPVLDADAVTIRLRSGLQISKNGFSILGEIESTLAIVDDFNDTNISNGIEPFAVVADPENVELNRLQVKYANQSFGDATLGRQRINLNDQRFVGSVGWRQNEQTFDAVSANITAIENVKFEATYANSQRTIFGFDAGPRTAFDGDYVFLGAATKLGPISIKGFSYLLDFADDEPVALTSTQTYGGTAAASFKLGDKTSLALRARYANQSDYQNNPNDFSVDYIDGWAALTVSGVKFQAGYENLGADGSGNRFQTPFSTLHKFNGWADLFLSTPAQGLEDKYAKISYNIPLLGGLNTLVAYHNFDSDIGGISFGDEIDASIAFKIETLNILLKYANYQADNFGIDTERFWFQIGYKF